MPDRMAFYTSVTMDASWLFMKKYSTSFTLGTKLFDKSIRHAIGCLYGYVRVADEIVDSFHQFPQADMLAEFVEETNRTLNRGMSTNPIIHAFAEVVHKYQIDREYIDAFLHSMHMDLDYKQHNLSSYKEYIYGSAEVVGLMCLCIFTQGDQGEFERLKPAAQSLGSAFQKVNFLRDVKDDLDTLDRRYFPELMNGAALTVEMKSRIIQDIQTDFDAAEAGIRQLPTSSRLGVFVAFKYYHKLLMKIKNQPIEKMLSERLRIHNAQKLWILCKSIIMFKLGRR